jgi:capsular exopolysaccharide synthesis family protein
MKEVQKYIGVNKKDGDNLSIRDEVEKYLRYWKWFLLSLILFSGLAYIYLRYSTPEYVATASILIKDNKKTGLSAELETFKDLGIVGGNSLNNTDNEVEILRSRKVVGAVVDSLRLNINYFISGRVVQSEVYGKSAPIKLELLKKNESLREKDTLLNIQIEEDQFSFLDEEGSKISTYNFGEQISNSLGEFVIHKNTEKKSEFVMVKVMPKYKAIDQYRNRIEISTVNKNSSVLVLSLQDPVGQKAKDILDELVKQYNLDAIYDKNQIYKKTIDFINVRLETVGEQLAMVQNEVRDYKIENDFIGLPEEVRLSLESLRETNQSIIELKSQNQIGVWIKQNLEQENQNLDVIPVDLGFENKNLSGAIQNYNLLILERERLKLTAGIENPILIDINNRIASSKTTLLSSIDNILNSINVRLDELKKEQSKVLGKVKAVPVTERGYIDIARKQEIMSGLYQYLLRKKEETDISLAVTVSNAKIIDSAYSSNIPVAPRKKVIFLFFLMIGIIIPFGIIYVRDLLDTKVHNKQDIESELSVPFLGDVPKSDSKEKIIIGTDVRSSTAEAFRLIRTNLDFMLASNRKQSKSIFITSTTSGEGKSFISINLAATLALSGQKVLLMGMDLRAPKVTEYLGIPERSGITNYITDEDILLEDLIFQIPEIKGLDIIASGVIPPNPAELLMTKRVENLFTIVKQEYDIVIVDTAPVNLVTDTLLIGKYADMFMYVVRANYLDKRLLAVPQELYNEQKLPNMAIVLNDTDPKRSYGYGYGGYGYGYVVVEKPWYKKIFSKNS